MQVRLDPFQLYVDVFSQLCHVVGECEDMDV